MILSSKDKGYKKDRVLINFQNRFFEQKQDFLKLRKRKKTNIKIISAFLCQHHLILMSIIMDFL